MLLEFVAEVEKAVDRSESESVEHLWKLIDAFRYENDNKFEQKIRVLTECYNYYKTLPDSSYFLQSSYQLGELFFRTGKYESGLKHLREVVDALPGVDHVYYSSATRKLARNYSKLGKHEVGLDLMTKLIKDYESQPGFKWDGKQLRHYLIKALLLNKVGRTEEAIQLCETVLEKAEKLRAKIILNNCKSSLARYYLELGELEKAKKFGLEAYEHYEILKLNYPSMAESRMTLGQIYFAEGNYKVAKNYYEKALEIASDHHRLMNESHAINGIINCNLKLGVDTDLIYEQLEYYKSLRDSLFNTDMANAVQDVQVKYETEKKQIRIQRLNEQKALMEHNLQDAKRNNFLLLFLLLLLLISALALTKLYMNRVKSQKLLSEKNRVIEESLSEKKLLLKEIHHRVKNNLQTVSSLLSLQSDFIEDKKVLEALQDGQNRVQSMALIHQNLYQEDDLKNIMAKTYFGELIKRLYRSYNIDTSKIQLTTDIDDITVDVETIIPLGLITNELISNVFKYAFPKDGQGTLFVALKDSSEKLALTIKDNGKGMDPKVLSEDYSSFGYQMIRAFCDKLEAQLQIDVENGTEVSITIIKLPNK